MPWRTVGRPADVVPASPLNTSSDANPSRHNESVAFSFGRCVAVADLLTVRAHERRDAFHGRAAWVDRRMRLRVHGNGRAASVVAVEALAGAQVELLRRRTHGTRSSASATAAPRDRPGIARVERVHPEAVQVAAQPGVEAQLRRRGAARFARIRSPIARRRDRSSAFRSDCARAPCREEARPWRCCRCARRTPWCSSRPASAKRAKRESR